MVDSTSRNSIVLPMILTAAALVGLLFLWPTTSKMLGTRERLQLDELHRFSKRAPTQNDIIILGIDDASLKLDGLWPEDLEAAPALQQMKTQWPWPRSVWAALLDKLFAAGAGQVFLDLTFKSPSADPSQDQLLAAALKRHGEKVLLGTKFERLRIGGQQTSEHILPHESVIGSPPFPCRLGVMSIYPEQDNIWRSTYTTITASSAEAIAAGDYRVVATPDEEQHPSVAGALWSYSAGVSLEPSRQHRIQFCAEDAYQPISMMEVFVPDLWKHNLKDGALFAGKTVLVGATSSDHQDYHETPLGRLAGVQIHAHSLAALATQSFVGDEPNGWRWYCLLAATLITWLVSNLIRRPLVALVLLLAAGFGFDRAMTWIFDQQHLELPSLPFLLALAATGIGGLTGGMITELQESRRMQRLLARYTSPELVREMMKDRQGLYTTLGGVERPVTIFFSDVRGFTSLSEQLSAGEVVARLNEYLGVMVAEIIQCRGLVDKFIGDAVMAVWGSIQPKHGPDERANAQVAVAACLAMRRALTKLNASFRERGQGEFQMGMGLHQGPAVVGNIGSAAPHEKMDLTVIGDSVNLASRLESITKEYGVDLVISEAIYHQVKDLYHCCPLDLVAVKGKQQPVAIFTVISEIHQPPPQGMDALVNAIQLYRDGHFTDAMAALAHTANFLPSVVTLYQQRLAELIAHPPETWTGVHTMTKK
jgi:adenylate cyclase